MFIRDIYPPIYLCTSCRCSGNSAFVPCHLPGHQGCVFRVFRTFSETITWTPGLFFSGFPHIPVVFFCGFSAHSRDMYCIFTSVWHIYSRHLPTKLLVYMLRMLQKFRTFPGTITWTPGCFFGFSAHYRDMYCIFTCVWYIYQGHLPSKLFVYVLQMLRTFRIFPRIITRTSGLFYSGFLHIYMPQGCAENPKKTAWCPGNCPGKSAEFPEHLRDVH